MRLNASVTSALLPGLLARAIYVVIAITAGASAAASIIGGVVIAIAIGPFFRAVFKRRTESRRA